MEMALVEDGVAPQSTTQAEDSVVFFRPPAYARIASYLLW